MNIGQASGGVAGGIGLDLALVLDQSGGMTTWSTATKRAAANALVASVPTLSRSIAAIGSSSTATLLAPLQSAVNQAALLAAANSANTNGGRTDTAEGIDVAAGILTADDNGRAKQMVVISDGAPDSQSAAETAASNAASGTPAVQVATVGLPGANFGDQQGIATAGGDVFVTTANIQDLIDLFNGAGGVLVGLASVDVTPPDGTVVLGAPTSGVGDFKTPVWPHPGVRAQHPESHRHFHQR